VLENRKLSLLGGNGNCNTILMQLYALSHGKKSGACTLTAAQFVQILETKTRKLEQLVRLKDAKIHALKRQLEAAGIS
jgi:hypothetical protein